MHQYLRWYNSGSGSSGQAHHRIAYSPFASFVGSGEFSVSMNGALFVAV